jgi:hypothetical protein
MPQAERLTYSTFGGEGHGGSHILTEYQFGLPGLRVHERSCRVAPSILQDFGKLVHSTVKVHTQQQ